MGKDSKTEFTVLPESVIPDLRSISMHQIFTARGYGEVELKYALKRKHTNAKYKWGWQYAFAAKDVSTDPLTGAPITYKFTGRV